MGSNGKTLPAEDILQVVSLYKEGYSATDIAEKLNMLVATVSAIVNGERYCDITRIRKPVNATKDPLTRQQIFQVVDLYEVHKDIGFIANELGIFPAVIFMILNGSLHSQLTGIPQNPYHKGNYYIELTVEDIIEIADLKGKLPIRTICEKYSIGNSTVGKIQNGKKYADITGIEYSGRLINDRITEETVLQIVKLLKDSKSPEEISNILNIPKNLVYRIKIGQAYSNISGIEHQPQYRNPCVKKFKGIMGVYRITNINNDKIYIGSSVDIGGRWYNHINELTNHRHKNKFLLEDFDKYGLDSFQIEIEEVVEDKAELFVREEYYINEYNLLDDPSGYNMAEVGDHLTTGEVKNIVKCIKNGQSDQDISDMYSVKPRLIMDIRLGNVYSNITGATKKKPILYRQSKLEMERI